jgi:hypothetical protein
VAAQRACKRCGHPMTSVAEIAPFGGGPGLVAFICTDCGATDSVLIRLLSLAGCWASSVSRSAGGSAISLLASSELAS